MKIDWRIGLAVVSLAVIHPPADAAAGARVSEIPPITFDSLFKETGSLGPSVAPDTLRNALKIAELPSFPAQLRKVVVRGDSEGLTFRSSGPLLLPLLHAMGGQVVDPVTSEHLSQALRDSLKMLVQISNLSAQAAGSAKGILPGPASERFEAITEAAKRLGWALAQYPAYGQSRAEVLSAKAWARTAVLLANANEARVLRRGGFEGLTLAIHPDGPGLRAWNPACHESSEGIVPTELPLPAGMAVRSMRFSPHGDFLAVAGGERVVAWNILTGEQRADLIVPAADGHVLALNESGEFLAVADFGAKFARLFNIGGKAAGPQGTVVSFPFRIKSLAFDLHDELKGFSPHR